MKNIKKLVPDTSIIIENLVSKKITEKEFKVEEVIIHEAVLSELEHQANVGREIGYLGLEEIKKLQELSKKNKFKLSFSGRRPVVSEIRHASLGEVDALIRDLASELKATLITGDKVQSKVAEAKGMDVIYIQPTIQRKELTVDKYFDNTTMSVHIRENTIPYAKRGLPGSWKVVQLETDVISQESVQNIAKEIVEDAKLSSQGFIESERRGSTIIQLGNYRILITRPPFSDGWEITIVRPIKKTTLDDYNLNEKLLNRIKNQAEGILIAGSPGHGKSTFAAALANFYSSLGKTVKTVENPRDLQVDETVTQYSIGHGRPEEIRDTLLLSRPDYTMYDEMRNIEDFKLFADLRLAGIGLAGVVHATKAVDAIQRFIGKMELGVIPQVIDTVLFIQGGKVQNVLSLNMIVKVPTGMTEEDLARPIVEIKDFETGKLKYEVYSYGEETVVIPVEEMKTKDPMKELASRQIEKEFSNFVTEIKAEITGNRSVTIYVPEDEIARVIGKDGETIKKLEKKIGLNINVESLNHEEEKREISFETGESKKCVCFFVDPRFRGRTADIHADEVYLFSSIIGKNGDINVNKKSKLGNNLLKILNNKRPVKMFI